MDAYTFSYVLSGGLTTDTLFQIVCNCAAAATPLMLVACALRLVNSKIRSRILIAVWCLVFLRLLCPLSLESELALLPQGLLESNVAAGVDISAEQAVQLALDALAANGEDPILFSPDRPVYTQTGGSPVAQGSFAMSRAQAIFAAAGKLWPVGVVCMLLYSLLSLLRLRKKLGGSIRVGENVYLCDDIPVAFVLGVIKPAIYLPSHLTDAQRSMVLAHEQTHLHRRDHLLKMLAWAALCVHWYHPLVWLCYHFFSADLEIACDETVTRHMTEEEQADYAQLLLHQATGRRMSTPAMLAFDEGSPLRRIQRVFSFQRPSGKSTAAVCLLLAVLCFLLLAGRREAPHLPGGGYSVSEIVYCDPAYADTYITQFRPDFAISGNEHLLIKTDWRGLDIVDFVSSPNPWTALGQLTACNLHRRDLTAYMPRDGWTEHWRPGSITAAWWLQTNDEANTFYLYFQTSRGEDYMAVGYEDLGERGQGASDDTSIHVLYRLDVTCGAILYGIDYYTFDAAFTFGRDVQQVFCYQLGKNADIPTASVFTDADGGIGIITYQADGGQKDGHLRQLQALYYDAQSLVYCQLEAEGCYIAPDPLVLDPDGHFTIGQVYDAVIITNPDAVSISRQVVTAEGRIVDEQTMECTHVPGAYPFLWADPDISVSHRVRYQIKLRP